MSTEGEQGPGLRNPCEHCGRHSTQPGKPSLKTRQVTYTCSCCEKRWTRPIEDDLASGEVVRVDLDDGYVYGFVVDLDNDRVAY